MFPHFGGSLKADPLQLRAGGAFQWRSEYNVHDLILSFLHMGVGYCTQVNRLSGKHLSLPSYLTTPPTPRFQSWLLKHILLALTKMETHSSPSNRSTHLPETRLLALPFFPLPHCNVLFPTRSRLFLWMLLSCKRNYVVLLLHTSNTSTALQYLRIKAYFKKNDLSCLLLALNLTLPPVFQTGSMRHVLDPHITEFCSSARPSAALPLLLQSPLPWGNLLLPPGPSTVVSLNFLSSMGLPWL